MRTLGHAGALRVTLFSMFFGACSGEPVRFAADASTDSPTFIDVALDVRDARADDASADAPVDRAPVDVQPADVPIAVGSSVDYVLTDFVIDGSAGSLAPNPAVYAQSVSGFNLDGRFTGGVAADPPDCGHGDFFSSLDADQNTGECLEGSPRGGVRCTGGVDNQLPAVADLVGGFGNDVRGSVRTLVRTGRTVVIVRVAGLEAPLAPTLDDDTVTVLVYPIAHPLFVSCAQTGSPGLMYAIDDASLTRAGDVSSARYRFPARIVRGRLRTLPSMAPGADFSVRIPLTGGVLADFELLRTQVRANLSADYVSAGNLGGFIPLSAVADAVIPTLPATIPMGTVNALLQTLVDVQNPPGDSEGCYAPNGAIALGMGFSGARAVVSDRTVTAPVEGMCGSLP